MICQEHNWYMFSMPCPKCSLMETQKITAAVTQIAPDGTSDTSVANTISQIENPEDDPWQIPEFLRRHIGDPVPTFSGPPPEWLGESTSEFGDPRIGKFMARVRNYYPRSLTNKEVLNAEIARGNQMAADVLKAIDNHCAIGKG